MTGIGRWRGAVKREKHADPAGQMLFTRSGFAIEGVSQDN
jgi:hypothetical protein